MFIRENIDQKPKANEKINYYWGVCPMANSCWLLINLPTENVVIFVDF